MKLLKSPIWLALAAVIFLRAVTLNFPDLIDTTEGRYSSVAKQMFQSGDLITPMIPMKQGWIPYWSKPPLNYWLEAGAFKLFGVEDWAARIPSLLMALLTAFFVFQVAKDFYDRKVAGLAATIFLTSFLVFLSAGSVNVDQSLSGCVAGALGCFALSRVGTRSKPSPGLDLLMFFFIGLGLVAKGPIAAVLVGAPLLCWGLYTRKMAAIWGLPWLRGILLVLIVAVPWFVVAELRNPGFLNYYLVNEHILRFLTPNYADRYGEGHVFPRGAALVMLAVCFLPWTIPAAVLGWRFRERLKDSQSVYLLAWGLFPALFFALARQLTAFYVLPGFGALAIVVARLAGEAAADPLQNKNLSWLPRSLYSFAALIAAVAIPLGYFHHSSAGLTLTVISLGLFALLCVLGAHIWEPGDLAVRTRHATVAFALCFAITLLQVGRAASEWKSTGPIISFIREKLDRDDSDRKAIYLGVLFGSPFSAYFYDNEVKSRDLVTVPVEPVALARSGRVREVIVKLADLKKLPPEVLSHFRIAKTIGRWTWLRRVRREGNSGPLPS
ncbi:MAG: glycosyltransferase family 39 protein [Oligoflexia bacterium]|nr:glycosyltransferase family 39 protein [Oligoflexia bacterium]